MGRLVKLWKSLETPESVEYRYGSELDCTGRLVITKTTGTVTLPDPVPRMSAQDSWFLFGVLAKAKAEIMFRKHEYLDETFIAT